MSRFTTRATAIAASAALHALLLLAAFGWLAVGKRNQAPAPGIETRTAVDITEFSLELERPERIIAPVAPMVKPMPTSEARIESAIQKMAAPWPISPPGPTAAGIALHKPLNYPGKSVVYVVDCSGSMGVGQRFERACAAAFASLENLAEGMKYQIVLYDSRPRLFDGGTALRPVVKSELPAVRAMLAKERPEGSSKHAAAIRTALKLSPDAIYLLTDADDFSAKDMAELTPLFRRESLNAILFGEAPAFADSPLQKLTRERRGGVYLAGKAGLEKLN